MRRRSPPIDLPGLGGITTGPPPLFPPTFDLVASYSDWRRTWTHIVAGKFSNSPYSGLLFYEQSIGYSEFYETRGLGDIWLLQSHSDWRNSWTHIVPGRFNRPDFTGLLFYDPDAGLVALYDTDGTGDITPPLREYSGWRSSWTHITTVRIPGSDYSGVVFYDQAAGYGEIYGCNGSGELELIIEDDTWRTSWTHIVGDPKVGTALLFYEGATADAEFHSIEGDGQGHFNLSAPLKYAGPQGPVPLPPATEIIAGNFGSAESGFFLNDRPSGHATFVFYNAPGDNPGYISLSGESYDNWSTSWDIIVPGKFWAADPEDLLFQNGFTDLLFYDHANGYGEFYLHEPYKPICEEKLEGYVIPDSVAPGDAIEFHVNSRVGPYLIKIYRQDLGEVLMTTIRDIQQFSQPFPIGRQAYRDGPGWPSVAEMVIPAENWPSGLYLARVETLPIVDPGGETNAPVAVSRSAFSGPPSYILDIPFVVRAANPGTQSRILFYIADATYQAYNFWGGRSLYGFTTEGGTVWSMGSTSDSPDDHQTPRAFRVARARPYKDAVGFPKWQYWEVPLIRWLAQHGINVEFCTGTDIHLDQIDQGGLLQNYRLLVSVGHDEYWSKEMRDNVESFATNGGNVAFFSGNVCWWQIRFDPTVERQICYKDARFDPLKSGLATVNWYDKPVNRPETDLTGVSYYNPAESAFQYCVLEPDHWVFAGVDFTFPYFGVYFVPNTAEFHSVVGPKIEKDRYQTGRLKSPANFVRLATLPSLDHPDSTDANSAAGTMGIFTKGKGQVFTVGTQNWSFGLSEERISQITVNVFSQLG